MALVVQKYGGSSVADADGIKRVAQRIVATRKGGDQVVVVVPTEHLKTQWSQAAARVGIAIDPKFSNSAGHTCAG